MKTEPILKRLQHPAINKSWFARKFHGIDDKQNHRVNTFIGKLNGRKGSKFTEEEINRLENIFKGFISDLI